jgi:hypothetical protein
MAWNEQNGRRRVYTWEPVDQLLVDGWGNEIALVDRWINERRPRTFLQWARAMALL